MDLCFLGSDGDYDKLVMLAVVDRKTNLIFVCPSPDNAIIVGMHSEYMIKKAVEGLDSLGCGSVILRSDKEIAM